MAAGFKVAFSRGNRLTEWKGTAPSPPPSHHMWNILKAFNRQNMFNSWPRTAQQMVKKENEKGGSHFSLCWLWKSTCLLYPTSSLSFALQRPRKQAGSSVLPAASSVLPAASQSPEINGNLCSMRACLMGVWIKGCLHSKQQILNLVVLGYKMPFFPELLLKLTLLWERLWTTDPHKSCSVQTPE